MRRLTGLVVSGSVCAFALGCSDLRTAPRGPEVRDGDRARWDLSWDPFYPGDADTSAAGIYIGYSITPEKCFGDRNPGITDLDNDWLEDHCELLLSHAFRPLWVFSAG